MILSFILSNRTIPIILSPAHSSVHAEIGYCSSRALSGALSDGRSCKKQGVINQKQRRGLGVLPPLEDMRAQAVLFNAHWVLTGFPKRFQHSS